MQTTEDISDAAYWQFPEKLRKMIEEELGEDEMLLWAAPPIPWRYAMKSLPIVAFGIPWTAFAVCWTFGAAGFQIPQFNQWQNLFPLFGLPFVLIGFGMLSSPSWMIRKARRTAYVLTNKRAILFEAEWMKTTVRSFGPEKLGELRRSQRSDGSGDVIFGEKISYEEHSSQQSEIGFLDIANVKQVEDLVRSVLSNPGESDAL